MMPSRFPVLGFTIAGFEPRLSAAKFSAVQNGRCWPIAYLRAILIAVAIMAELNGVLCADAIGCAQRCRRNANVPLHHAGAADGSASSSSSSKGQSRMGPLASVIFLR